MQTPGTRKSPFIFIPPILVFLSVACICTPFSLLNNVASSGGEPKESGSVLQQDRISPQACQDRLADIIAGYGYLSEEELLPSEYSLVTYQVAGDLLSNPEFSHVPSDLESYQLDTQGHEQLWRFVTDVVPLDYRLQVDFFLIFTDGVGGTLGAVEQTEAPDAWMLEMDIRDAENYFDLSTTLVHEVAHLFTLNTAQVETDWNLFNDPDDPDAYREGAEACDTYFMFEGCSRPDSFINLFFQSFWPDIYDQWTEIDAETDQDIRDGLLYDFYRQYPDRFVSDYAATSPEEDIAESFMYFIFSEAPSGDTLAEQKILFFYEFPEMLALRDQMVAGLCDHLP